MTELFLALLNRSLAAGWLILAVLPVRLLLKKASKDVTVLLWALVAVRLLCPAAMESPVSLIPADIGSGRWVAEWADDYVGEISILHDNSQYYDTRQDPMEEPDTVGNTVMPVLAAVWAVGMVLVLVYGIVSYLRLRRRVCAAIPQGNGVYRSDRIQTPFVLGFFKPRIYLPFALAEQSIPYVIAHEQAHIRRLDHLWKPLGLLLVSLHWFNPLVWLAYALLCRDIELACDETVIGEMDQQQRADYSEALLRCSARGTAAAACPPAFGEVGVKERIKAVLYYKKPALWTIIASALVCLILVFCFLTNPGEQGIRETHQGNLRTYYEMTDGTWQCEDVVYAYRLELQGRLPNAACDTAYVYLSNVEISFEQAWKASGISSDLRDYFAAEEAVLVEMRIEDWD